MLRVMIHNPYTQYTVHMWGAVYWLINFPLVCCLFFFTPTLPPPIPLEPPSPI